MQPKQKEQAKEEFNTASLGYVLESDDEVVAIGKFQ